MFNPSLSLKTIFALQSHLLLYPRVSERTGKLRVLEGKACGLVYWFSVSSRNIGVAISKEEWSRSEVSTSKSLRRRRLTVWIKEVVLRDRRRNRKRRRRHRRLGFRCLVGKEDDRSYSGRVSCSASNPAHRWTRAAFVSAQQRSSRRTPVAHFPNFVRVLTARLGVYVGSDPSISATRLGGLIGRLDLSARYHYNISIPRFLALLKPFLPLVFLYEVSMVPIRQRQIVLGVYFDK